MMDDVESVWPRSQFNFQGQNRYDHLPENNQFALHHDKFLLTLDVIQVAPSVYEREARVVQTTICISHCVQRAQIFRTRVLQPSKRFFWPQEKTSDLKQT